MIGLKEIIVALNVAVSKQLNLTVDSKDIEEEFERPSVRTNIEGLKTSAFMTSMRERSFTLRVYYFPSKPRRNRIELFQVQEVLEKIFLDSLCIKEEYFLYFDEVEFEVADGVLIASAQVQTFDDFEVEEDLYEWMEVLEVRRGYINEHRNGGV